MTKAVINRNQSIELWSKSMDWFPYGNRLRHERANMPNHLTSTANTMLKQRHRWKLKTFNMSPFKPYALCKHALHTLLIYENTSSVCKKEILILQKLRRKYFCRSFAIKLSLCKKSVSIWSFLVRVFPYSNWLRTRKTPNTDTFHEVYNGVIRYIIYKKTASLLVNSRYHATIKNI